MKTNRINTTRRQVAKPTLGQRFQKFFKPKKKYHSEVYSNEYEMNEDAPSRPVVRLVVVLIMLHVIVVGGILMRGYLRKSGEFQVADNLPAVPAHNVAPDAPAIDSGSIPTTNNMTTESSVTVDNGPLDLPQPDGTRMASHSPNAANTNSLETPVLGPNSIASNDASPGNAQPVTSPETLPDSDSSSKPLVGSVKHLVVSSDTWDSIALDNGCTKDNLVAANPNVTLRPGIQISIPVPDGVTNVYVLEDASEGASTYKLKKGETLSHVAKKYNTTVKKIMTANNFKEADTRRLKIGQEIKIPQ